MATGWPAAAAHALKYLYASTSLLGEEGRLKAQDHRQELLLLLLLL
jgi:hypothetical protein